MSSMMRPRRPQPPPQLLLLLLLLLACTTQAFFVPASRIPQPRGRALYSSTSDEGIKGVRKMKAAAIKKELQTLGVSTAGIIDKEDLVTLLVKSRVTHSPSSRSTSSSSSSTKTSTNAATCYAARVPFRQKTPPTTLPGGGETGPGPKSYVCVDVSVNGENLEFLIDSGATPTIITERTRARLNLQPLSGGQTIQGVTATGSGAAPRVMLTNVSLGGGKATVNMDALVMGNQGVLPPGVDGLLGVVWMRYFGIVDFDWRSSTLTVYPHDARNSAKGGSTELVDLLEDAPPALLARAVPMRQDPMSGIYFVDVFLDDPRTNPSTPPVPAIVDLGAGMSMVNWRAARSVGIDRETSLKVIRNAMGVWGIDGKPMSVDLCDFNSMWLRNDVALTRKRIGVADLPAFGLIGYGDKPVGVVGMDVLGGTDPNSRRIVFDFRRSMLYTM